MNDIKTTGIISQFLKLETKFFTSLFYINLEQEQFEVVRKGKAFED